MAWLAGCASIAPVPTIVDASAGNCPIAETADGVAGDWLVGRWTQSHSTLDIRREGPALVYEWTREAGMQSDYWGEKAAAGGRGQVIRLSSCSIEMTGAYTWSSSSAIIGRKMILHLSLDSPRTLRGRWYGAGERWLVTAWWKAE